MNRLPFVLRLKPDMKDAGIAAISIAWDEIRASLHALHMTNCSVWSIEDFLFFYGEYADGADAPAADAVIMEIMAPYAELFAAPGTLPLMYHDIGIVRADKSLIRHRVFATKLKDGCDEEYKARHDALIAARDGSLRVGPESNFTIWNANGYIFGYCELVKSFDHEMTEDEKASTIAWETRQLEIMDWLTDDVDWITGEKHDAIRLIGRG